MFFSFFWFSVSGVTSGMFVPMSGKSLGFMSLGTFGFSGLPVDGVTDDLRVISLCFSLSPESSRAAYDSRPVFFLNFFVCCV